MVTPSAMLSSSSISLANSSMVSASSNAEHRSLKDFTVRSSRAFSLRTTAEFAASFQKAGSAVCSSSSTIRRVRPSTSKMPPERRDSTAQRLEKLVGVVIHGPPCRPISPRL